MSFDQLGLRLQAAERRVTATLRERDSARVLHEERALTSDEFRRRVLAHRQAEDDLATLMNWLREPA
jgi:hypothetical protein